MYMQLYHYKIITTTFIILLYNLYIFVHLDPLPLKQLAYDNQKRLNQLEATVEKLVEKLTSIESLLSSAPVIQPSIARHTPSRLQAFSPPIQNHTPVRLQELHQVSQQPLLSPQQQLPSPQQRPTSTKPPKNKQTLRLPSSDIPKEKLVPLATVIEENKEMLNSDSKMSTFALNLAREAYFGEEIMVQCTAHGYGDTPGLPLVELQQLKEEVRRHYPKYWNSPQEFELKWKACTESISQGCKRMRLKLLKKKK